MDNETNVNIIITTESPQVAVDDRSNYTNDLIDQEIIHPGINSSISIQFTIGNIEIYSLFGQAQPWTREPLLTYLSTNQYQRITTQISYTSETPEYVLAEVLSIIIARFCYSILLNDIPFGIQDTQPHSITVIYLPARSNEIFIIPDDNSEINEDATTYTETTMNEIPEDNQIEISDDTETVTVNELNNINREDVQMDQYLTFDGSNDELCDTNYPTVPIEAPRRGNTIPRPQQDDNQVPPTISTLVTDSSLPSLSRTMDDNDLLNNDSTNIQSNSNEQKHTTTIHANPLITE